MYEFKGKFVEQPKPVVVNQVCNKLFRFAFPFLSFSDLFDVDSGLRGFLLFQTCVTRANYRPLFRSATGSLLVVTQTRSTVVAVPSPVPPPWMVVVLSKNAPKLARLSD
jgi:hypothetical protein